MTHTVAAPREPPTMAVLAPRAASLSVSRARRPPAGCHPPCARARGQGL